MECGADVTLAIVPSGRRGPPVGRGARRARRAGRGARDRSDEDVAAGALTSLARYELAVACGCPWTERRFRAKIPRVYDARAHLGRATRLMARAARSGDPALLERLRAEGCGLGRPRRAPRRPVGQIATLQWARANGCHWDATTAQAAARSGHLECCSGRWQTAARRRRHVRRRRAPPPGARVAAPRRVSVGRVDLRRGRGRRNLEALRWARTSGCPWDESTCDEAAAGGHLAVLKWARAEGCGWTAMAATRAADGQHVATLRWMVENASARSTAVRWRASAWRAGSSRAGTSRSAGLSAARRRPTATLSCCSGCGRGGATGTTASSPSTPRRPATSRCCSGPAPRAAGTAYASMPRRSATPRVVAWLLANGCRHSPLRKL